MSWLTNLIGGGRVTLADDAGEVQELQVTEGATGTGFADRIIDRVRRIGTFGFASVPPLGAEVLLLRRGGDRGQSLAIGTNHRPSRPRGLKPGDSGVYDVRGAKMMLTEGGLRIDCAGLPALLENCPTVTLKATEKLIIDAPAAEFTGTVTAAGEITALSGGSAARLGGLRDAYNAHKHGAVRTGTDVSGPTSSPA